MSLSIATRLSTQAAQVIRVQQRILELSSDYDVIIIDTPPSAGSALTAVFIRLSDYFITPVSPTFFSLQAIDNLGTIFRSWNQQFNWITGFEDRVKYLGSAVQMAKQHAGGSNASDFSAAATNWINTLNERMQPFQEWMLSIGKSITETEFQKTFPNKKPFIAETCCDFTPQLRGIAERAGVPVISLTQELCNQFKPASASVDITNNPQGQYKISFDKINEQYRGLAANLGTL